MRTRNLLSLLALLFAVNANAQRTNQASTIAMIDPPRGLIDLHHIERNASYTVFGLLLVLNEEFSGYFSWDTDDDGVIGALYYNELNDKLSFLGGLAYKDNKAGNNAVMGLANLIYSIGDGYVGGGLQLEKGTDTDVANTVGKQDTLTYRVQGGYEFQSWNLGVIAEKYNYRNPTYKELNSMIPDSKTSSEGLSAITLEGSLTRFGNYQPYILFKFKEFDGPLDDDEVRIGLRWMF